MSEIELHWAASRYEDGSVIKDRGTCYDGAAYVGAVYHQTVLSKPAWAWSMTATGLGREGITTSGHVGSREEAKALLEQAYRELAAAAPGNRDYWQERCRGLRWRDDFRKSAGKIGRYEDWDG